MLELNSADQLDSRPREGRGVRQVARTGPRLVDKPQPILGGSDTGMEERRSALSHGSTSTGASTSSNATSVSGPTDLHRPAIDELVSSRTRTTRPAGRRCDGLVTSSTAGSSQARCRSPRSTTPSRTPAGSSSTSPQTSSSSTSARPAGWFYTMHVLSTALFDLPPFENCIVHGIISGRRRPQDVQAPGQLPRPGHGLRPMGRRRDAMVPALVFGVARPGPDRPRRGLRGRGTPRAQPDLEHVVLLLSTPTSTRSEASTAPTPTECSTATCSPRPPRSSLT